MTGQSRCEDVKRPWYREDMEVISYEGKKDIGVRQNIYREKR